MNIKENQLAVFRRREPEGETYDVYNNEPLMYFTPGFDLKPLRKNSRNLEYYDGCNWHKIEIEFVGIINAITFEAISSSPCFAFKRKYEMEDGSILDLITSNESRHLTPYWSENVRY